MGKDKPKFQKNKCIKCKYHTKQVSGAYQARVGGKTIPVACDYSTVTGRTCLTEVNGKIVDRRGNDYYNCKLFVKGVAHEKESEPVDDF